MKIIGCGIEGQKKKLGTNSIKVAEKLQICNVTFEAVKKLHISGRRAKKQQIFNISNVKLQQIGNTDRLITDVTPHHPLWKRLSAK